MKTGFVRQTGSAKCACGKCPQPSGDPEFSRRVAEQAAKMLEIRRATRFDFVRDVMGADSVLLDDE